MRRVVGRGVRATLVGLVVAALGLGWFATPRAAAESGDRVADFAIAYTVDTSGVLHVTENIAYAFGSSGRHGIYRYLIDRQSYPDDTSKDQRYDISDIRVSSPDASAKFTTSKAHSGRTESTKIQIGDSDKTISGESAHYTISYEVKGALRHFSDHDELYWNATGDDWDATLEQVDVKVSVPGGVQQLQCYTGRSGSTESCQKHEKDGQSAAFRQDSIARGDQLTIVTGIKPGLIPAAAASPIVVGKQTGLGRAGISVGALIGALAVSVVALVGGALVSRRAAVDERFAGVSPGSFPPQGSSPPVERNTLDDKSLPPMFTPPNIRVGEAGLLIDGTFDKTEAPATLVDLAVRGAVQIQNGPQGLAAVLTDPSRADAPHEQALLSGMFPTLQPGDVVMLEKPKTGDTRMYNAVKAMQGQLMGQVRGQGWYARMPWNAGGNAARAAGCGCTSVLVFPVVGFIALVSAVAKGSASHLVIIVPFIAIAIGVGLIMNRYRRGRRSAVGRALNDQLLGFKEYLSTAEADQLRFEEGEDIFSRYLPWAIVFDLTERWQRICQQLVAMGRLPDTSPYWFAGANVYAFNMASMNTTMASAFAPPPSASGGGSGSGFGGGSSGGGGGGGGGGSW